jgi:DNA repair protein RadC
MLTQHFFEFEEAEFDRRGGDLATEQLLPGSELDESQYASVKRVSVIFERSLCGRPCLTSSEASKDFFKQYWNDNPAWDQEQFVVACLDTKHRVQCVVRVTVGTLDASLVHPREVFKPAIIEGSSAVILSHNHPSGNTTPSREDIDVTDRLTEAGKLLGITVLDHIIHGDGTGEVLSIRESR